MPDPEPAGQHGPLARPQVKEGPAPARTRADLVLSLAALALGAPGSAGLALGWPLADWPVPFHPQLYGDLALRTVVYLSGFLAAYGVIGLVWWIAGDSPDGAIETAPNSDAIEGRAFLSEPLCGFLPAAQQRRIARETGYQALLYTKISILLSGAIGVLLAGSWEPVSVLDALAPDVALRVSAGLYLMAESVRRYQAFARGEPSGTLVGTLVHGALSPFLGRGTRS